MHTVIMENPSALILGRQGLNDISLLYQGTEYHFPPPLEPYGTYMRHRWRWIGTAGLLSPQTLQQGRHQGLGHASSHYKPGRHLWDTEKATGDIGWSAATRAEALGGLSWLQQADFASKSPVHIEGSKD